MKSMVWVGMVIGSAVGGYAPVLFGGSALSFTSVITTAIGGILGIWIGFKLENW